MKRLFILIVAVTSVLVSFAQTPEEIVDRKSEDVIIPILGVRVADNLSIIKP